MYIGVVLSLDSDSVSGLCRSAIGPKLTVSMFFLCISLTEVSDLIGFSFRFKEGNTQKHTQSVNRFRRQPAADRASTF